MPKKGILKLRDCHKRRLWWQWFSVVAVVAKSSSISRIIIRSSSGGSGSGRGGCRGGGGGGGTTNYHSATTTTTTTTTTTAATPDAAVSSSTSSTPTISTASAAELMEHSVWFVCGFQGLRILSSKDSRVCQGAPATVSAGAARPPFIVVHGAGGVPFKADYHSSHSAMPHSEHKSYPAAGCAASLN